MTITKRGGNYNPDGRPLKYGVKVEKKQWTVYPWEKEAMNELYKELVSKRDELYKEWKSREL